MFGKDPSSVYFRTGTIEASTSVHGDATCLSVVSVADQILQQYIDSVPPDGKRIVENRCSCSVYIDRDAFVIGQLVVMIGIRKSLDLVFTQRELKILDDVMPETSKKHADDLRQLESGEVSTVRRILNAIVCRK